MSNQSSHSAASVGQETVSMGAGATLRPQCMHSREESCCQAEEDWHSPAGTGVHVSERKLLEHPVAP